MGCDIHMFIEYKTRSETSFVNFGGEYDGVRNYQLFGLLAKGVRILNDRAIPLKGLPDFYTLGDETRQRCSILVTDEFYHDVNKIFTKEAQELVIKGKNRFLDSDNNFIIDVDTHSHSWLTVKELELQLSLYQQQLPQGYHWIIEYTWILETMRMIEKSGHDVRLVFWFDN